MPSFHVSKSIVIDVPIDKTYASVRDFHQWPVWSPWLMADPNAEVTHESDGSGYAWESAICGSGAMKVLSESAPKSIDYQLDFITPWKSTCPVSFRFAEKEGGTEATWTMEGSLPWFMFFMKNMMAAFVGMDYERGLLMLKDYLETGSVPSKLEFPGPTAFTGFPYIAVKSEGAIDDVSELMGVSFGKVQSWLDETNTQPAGKPFSIYHKWDPVGGIVKYTLGYPIDSPLETAPEGFVTGEIPSMEVYPIVHIGPYKHLGNAWSAGIMHGRSKQFKQGRQIHPFEIYETMPGDVSEEDIQTVIHFPIKG